MPSHNHSASDSGHYHGYHTDYASGIQGGSSGDRVAYNGDGSSYTATTNYGYASVSVGYSGGDAYHNNLQPYIVVYFWRRTA